MKLSYFLNCGVCQEIVRVQEETAEAQRLLLWAMVLKECFFVRFQSVIGTTPKFKKILNLPFSKLPNYPWFWEMIKQ